MLLISLSDRSCAINSWEPNFAETRTSCTFTLPVTPPPGTSRKSSTFMSILPSPIAFAFAITASDTGCELLNERDFATPRISLESNSLLACSQSIGITS